MLTLNSFQSSQYRWFFIVLSAHDILTPFENPLGIDTFIVVSLWRNKTTKVYVNRQYSLWTLWGDVTSSTQTPYQFSVLLYCILCFLVNVYIRNLTCTSSPSTIFLVVVSTFPLSLRVKVPFRMSPSMTQDPCVKKVRGSVWINQKY